MSCNGCRVLRKGCSNACVLRHCLRCIDSPEAQAYATLFVTKFFGRAGLTGFINGVSENQRPALFQSLLYEACGRTVNPVYGAVGLLFSGNWAVCQAAVETVLRGGSPKPISAACDVSTNHMKPNTSSAPLHDHPAGSAMSTLDHPAGFNNKHMQESSLAATSACSFQANFPPAPANHCVLDFSYYSVSSSAEDMISKPNLNKRLRDCEPETSAVEEDPITMRPRSSFLYGYSAAAAAASAPAAAASDPCHAVPLMAPRPSITTWIAGYNKANCGRIFSNDSTINYDVPVTVGRGVHVVSGEEIKHATHDVLAKTMAVPGPREQLVTPVARRVYIPPHTQQGQDQGVYIHPHRKQGQEKDDAQEQQYGGVLQMSMKKLSNESTTAGGDDHEGQYHERSGREDCVPSFSCSVHQDTMSYECGHVTNIKLDLSLQAQSGAVCCDDNELVNNSPHDTLELIKHEEPHPLLRMSSPSVNSEGSVNTGLDRSSCTALESPKEGLKLLNLLL